MAECVMNKILLTLSLIISSSAYAEVYQCSNGSFSSKPCTSAKTAADLVRENKAKEQAKADAERARQKEEDRRNARPEPYIGMPVNTESSWGYPTKTNVSKYAFGTTEQHVFRYGHTTKYLHFTNGRLTNISE